MTLPAGQAKANKIEYDKKWRDENRDRVNALARARRKANPEKEKEKKRRLYLKNQEKALAYATKYREANKEKIKASAGPKNVHYVRRYRERHPEKMRASSRAWKANHPEQHAESSAKWSAENPEKRRTYSHNRRGKVRDCGGTLSPDLAFRLLKLQKGKCACCGKSLKGGYEMDHIIALSKGGKNIDSNIQLLTISCNRSKGSQDPVEFMQKQRGMLL